MGLVETNRGVGLGRDDRAPASADVSHVIGLDRAEGYAADWVRFTPSYFDGGAPFGEAYGAHVYWYVQEDGDGFIQRRRGRLRLCRRRADRRLGRDDRVDGGTGL